ncbi:MAG TPA: hypothetical protein VLI72_08835 [Methylibium sp.]|nr:hypothetical protein [Methylibium sp.]
MLILVDGKRNFDALAKLGGILGEPDELLDQLLSQGFIESASAAPPAAAVAPSPGEPSSAKAAAGLSLAEAQRYVARRLTDLLGPMGEDLCLRIERTRNVSDFNAAVAKAQGIVREFRGAEIAAGFAADVAAHRPAQ